MTKVKKIIFGAGFVALYLTANFLSHEDEIAQQRYACEMAGKGYWPDHYGNNCN